LDPKSLSDLLSRPASEFVQKDVIFLDANSSVKEAAAKMKETGLDSVIVTEGGLPAGMVTERDLCYRIVAEGLDPRAVTLKTVMSRPLITLSKSRPLGEALNLMSSRATRRLVLVNSDGTLFGLVTRWGFTGQGSGAAISLPVNRGDEGLVCPFCASVLDNAESLSKHIDQVHISGELAGGNAPLWTRKDNIGA
jgi:CBS domain-containing protein